MSLLRIFQTNEAELQFSKDVKGLVKKLKKIDQEFDRKKLRALIRNAGKPILDAAKQNAPVSSKTHFRYAGGRGAGFFTKGKKGRIVAAYRPGHLRNSIKFLRFKRTLDIFIGPTYSKSRIKAGTSKIYDGRLKTTSDAYYAHWAEYGYGIYKKNPSGFGYMRKAFDTKKGITERRMERNLRNRLKRVERKLAKK